MKLVVSQGNVPVGSYSAVFTGVEAAESQFGKGLKWGFEVVAGQHAGSKVSAFTGASPSPVNKAGRIVAGLVGRPISPNEEVDLSPCVGAKYLIVVEATEKGSKVTTVTSLPMMP